MSFQDQSNTQQDPANSTSQEPQKQDSQVADQNTFDLVQKRLSDSQSHIATLESETKGYREQVSAQDAKLAELEKTISQLSNAALTNQKAVEDNTSSQLTLAQVDTHIAQAKAAELGKSNYDKAMSIMSNTYGADAYGLKLDTMATEMGMTIDAAKSMASSSPDAFVKLFGGSVKKDIAPTQPSFTASNFDSNVVEQNPSFSNSIIDDTKSLAVELGRMVDEENNKK